MRRDQLKPGDIFRYHNEINLHVVPLDEDGPNHRVGSKWPLGRQFADCNLSREPSWNVKVDLVTPFRRAPKSVSPEAHRRACEALASFLEDL